MFKISFETEFGGKELYVRFRTIFAAAEKNKVGFLVQVFEKARGFWRHQRADRQQPEC